MIGCSEKLKPVTFLGSFLYSLFLFGMSSHSCTGICRTHIFLTVSTSRDLRSSTTLLQGGLSPCIFTQMGSGFSQLLNIESHAFSICLAIESWAFCHVFHKIIVTTIFELNLKSFFNLLDLFLSYI